MRILFATRAIESPATEGGFVLLSDLAYAMAKEPEFEVGMFSVNKGVIHGVNCIGGYSGTGWNRRKAFQFTKALQLNQSNFDIVHTAHVPTNTNSTLLRGISLFGRRKGIRYIHTLTAVSQVKTADFRKLLWADAYIGQTNEMLNHLTEINKPSTCIVPWPSIDRIGFKESRRQLTRKNRFPNFKKVFVLPGEFSRLGIDSTFSYCVQTILKEVPDSCFVFACRYDKDGVGAKIVEDCQKDFPGRVFNLGEINWVIPLIEAADLILFPALKMQGKFQPPLVLMEALGLSRPILVSSIVSMPFNMHNMVTYSNAKSWLQFGRAAVRILKEDNSFTIDLSDKFKDTVLAYKNFYLKMYGKL